MDRAKRIKNDEFYTTYLYAEYMVNLMIGHVDDKIIYCPCDSEKSNIVKCIKDYKERLNYKDLWFTSDDYNKHSDLFEKCDIIVTNPPFSIFGRQFYPYIKRTGKEFLVVGPIGINNETFADINSGYVKVIYMKALFPDFITSDGYKPVISLLYNNSDIIRKNLYPYKTKDRDKPLNIFTKSFNDIDKKYIDGTDILSLDRMSDVPYDYTGLMSVPAVTIPFVMDYLQIIENRLQTNYYVNGKKLFCRVLVKIKDINIT